MARARPLTADSGRGRLAKNSALFFGDRLFVAALNFLTFAMIARFYGPSDMGRWSYAFAAVNVAAPLLAAGAEPVIIREVVNDPSRRLATLGTGALLILASTAVSTGLSLLWMWLEVGWSDIFWMSLVFAAATVPNFLLVIEHQLKAAMLARTVVVMHMATAAVGAAVRIALALRQADLVLLASSYVVEAAAVSALLLFVAIRRGEAPWRWGVDRRTLTDVGRQTLPLAFSLLVVSLFFRLNFFLLAKLSTFDQVGKFALASSVVQAVGIVPPAVSSAVYPRLIAIANESRMRAVHLVGWIVYAFTAIGYLLCLACIVAAPTLPFIFGQRYDGTQWIMVILSTTIVFNFSGAARALLINIEAVPRYHLISAMIGLMTVGAGSVMLIPLYGAAGAALVQAVACFVSPFLTTVFFRQVRVLAVAQFASLLLIPPRAASPAGAARAFSPP